MEPITRIRLCLTTGQPIDPGNYDGPVHCLGHPDGHDCVTGMFDIDRSTIMFESQRNALGPTHINVGTLPGEPTGRSDRCGCGHRLDEHGGSGCAADDEAAMGGCDCPVKGETRKRSSLGLGGIVERPFA